MTHRPPIRNPLPWGVGSRAARLFEVMQWLILAPLVAIGFVTLVVIYLLWKGVL